MATTTERSRTALRGKAGNPVWRKAPWGSRIMWTLRSAAGAGSCCVIATHDRELIDQLYRRFSMSDGRLTGES